MRVILIGTGFWGAGWGRLLSDFGGADLVGVVNRSSESLTRTCDVLRIDADRRFTNLSQALGAVAADAAVVVVPAHAHVEVAIECLEAGLDCLVEKPLARSARDAAPAVESARHLGRTLMVAQTYRFKRGPHTVRKLLAEGAVGAIETVDVRYAKSIPSSGTTSGALAEPLIAEFGVHHFDFIRGVLGLEPSCVRADSFNPSWSWFTGNAAATVEFRTPEAARILWTGSWVTRGPQTSWDGDWLIQGPLGSIHWAANRIVLRPVDFMSTVYWPGALERTDGMLAIPLVELPAEERLGAFLEFQSAVSEGREPRPSGADHLRTLALVDAALEATHTGDWIAVTSTEQWAAGQG